MNLLNLSAIDIAQKIASKEITVVSVIRFYIDRIKTQDGMACLSALFEEQALQKATHLDALLEEGKVLSPLHGIPILLKDNLDVQGEVTHAGTKYLTHTAAQHGELASQLEALGMVILGKTKMTELAFGLSGQNPVQGTPSNAWSKKTLSPGGSSSGSAVAVALGFSPLTIGGDTGGSIRTPAALNGIVGFKPSSGKIATSGAVPLSATLDTLGPMALDIHDIDVLFQLLTKHTQIDSNIEQNTEILFLQESDFPYPLEDEVLQLWRAHLNVLQQCGFQLKPWQKPAEIDLVKLSDFTSDIIAYESYQYHGQDAEDPTLEMWDIVRNRVLRGKQISQSHYESLIHNRAHFMEVFNHSLLNQCLLFPVSPCFAQELDPEDKNFTHVGEYTRPFNYLDVPGCTYPIGFNTQGLAMGVQLLAAHNQDHRVLNMVQHIMAQLKIRPTVAIH